MKSYRDLDSWKVGVELLKEINRLVLLLPQMEQYEMGKQLRRSSKSVLANIAEGFGRFTYPDKANKYIIARGECSEIDAFLAMAIELKYLTQEQCNVAFASLERERKLLSGLINACKRRS